MQQIRLGKSPLLSSQLAYGCWRIAASTDSEENMQIARKAIFAAIDSGFTLFDHADIYCNGAAEEVFGRILRENSSLRSRMLIASKCGIRPRNQPAGAPTRYDFSKEYIRTQCERSLRALGVEHLDLLQLHRPDYLMEVDEVADVFCELHAEGKVRSFGVSNFRPSQLSLLQSALSQPLVVHQIEISLLQLGPFEDGSLDQCQEKSLTPLAWSPLGGGLLAHGGKDLLPGQRLYDPARVVGLLDQIALEKGSLRESVALAWLLKHPAGIIPIVGSTNPGRIRNAAQSVQIRLERAEWYALLESARAEPLP
ncbi:MAG: hypothetical protein RLZZ244_1263 [Verrucomicrobiota bacterium]|jgi:predicted oxidoreductase